MKEILNKMRKDIDDDIIDEVIANSLGSTAMDLMHVAIGWQQIRDMKKMQTQAAFEELLDED